jgi:hypothetical protein
MQPASSNGDSNEGLVLVAGLPDVARIVGEL